MSQSFPVRQIGATRPVPWGFLLAWLALILGAGVLSGLAPLRLSIVAVFLFAGPHNWFEGRYFLARLPARAGKLRGYLALAFAGVVGLSGCLIALTLCRELGWLSGDTHLVGYALTQTLFVLWVVALAQLRSQTNPRREWGWLWSAAFLAIAAVWLAPVAWGVALVYLHPLLALWLLDRELRRSRPAWQPAFRVCLFLVPAVLLLLLWRFSDASLPASDALGRKIAEHAGAFALPGLCERALIATHAFLEVLHYAVWIVLMPLASLKSAPWNVADVPLTWRGRSWSRALTIALLVGVFLVVALWVGFVADYSTTRAVYFTVATLHVLAEFPFLIRSL
jgi:hypothetical protein